MVIGLLTGGCDPDRSEAPSPAANDVRQGAVSRLKPATVTLLVLLTVLFMPGLAAAAPGDPLPTAPVGDLVPGQTCQARTVMSGVAITSFDVEILEVARFDDQSFGRLIYFEITDPAIAEIGVAAGMSGSPILCQIGGTDRVVGAISYAYDGLGPKGFATPIEDVLNGQPAPAPLSVREHRETLRFRGRKVVPLIAPLTVTGVPPAAQARVRKALVRRGANAVIFPQSAPVDVPSDAPELAPGGAFSMNYSYGDITVGAICTISYRDGDRFWGCGHPLDLAGERNLSISGAYIFDVLGRAWGYWESPFKLGSPTTTQVGAMLYDGPFAVSGRLGRTAPSTPVKFTLNSGAESRTLESRVVAEQDLPGGSPDNFSYVPVMAGMLAAKAQFESGGQPTVQRGRICLKQSIYGLETVADSCSRFASSYGSWQYLSWDEYTGAAMPTAFFTDGFATLLAAARFKSLTPGPLEVSVDIATGSGLRQIVGLKAAGRLVAGRTGKLKVISADSRGNRYRQTVKLRIPRKVLKGKKRGRRILIRVKSSSIYLHDLDPGDRHYLAVERSGAAWKRYVFDPADGEAQGAANGRELAGAIRALFNRRSNLELSLPGVKTPRLKAIQSGDDVLVGSAAKRVFVRPGHHR